MGLSRIASPSLLQEMMDDQEPQAEVMSARESVASTLPTAHALKPRLDITALEPGMAAAGGGDSGNRVRNSGV